MSIDEAIGFLSMAVDGVFGAGGGRKGAAVLDEFSRLVKEYEAQTGGEGGFREEGPEPEKNRTGPVWSDCPVCGAAHDPREGHLDDEVLPVLDPPEGPQLSEGAPDAGHDHVSGSDPSTHALPGKEAK